MGVRATIYADLEDPRLKIAMDFSLFLARSVIEPAWATFITHGGRLVRDSDLMGQIRRDLEAGTASGIFFFEDVNVALNLIIGTKVSAMRSIGGRGGQDGLSNF